MQSCGVIRIYHKKGCRQGSTQIVCNCNELEGIYLKEEYFQNNGIKEGVLKKYYYNGNIHIECNYINGRRNGICREYDLNCEEITECNYIDDIFDGIYKIYKYQEHILLEEGFLNNEREIKYRIIYWDNLNIRLKIYNDNAYFKRITEYYKNGVLHKEYNYINDKIEGNYKEYDENGNLLNEYNYIDGIKIIN